MMMDIDHSRHPFGTRRASQEAAQHIVATRKTTRHSFNFSPTFRPARLWRPSLRRVPAEEATHHQGQGAARGRRWTERHGSPTSSRPPSWSTMTQFSSTAAPGRSSAAEPRRSRRCGGPAASRRGAHLVHPFCLCLCFCSASASASASVFASVSVSASDSESVPASAAACCLLLAACCVPGAPSHRPFLSAGTTMTRRPGSRRPSTPTRRRRAWQRCARWAFMNTRSTGCVFQTC